MSIVVFLLTLVCIHFAVMVDRLINDSRHERQALMESLVRDSGKQLIFSPPAELEKSSGWFDIKGRISTIVGGKVVKQ